MHLDSLGEFYLNKGDYDLAIRYYMEATAIDPTFSWGPRNTALAQYQAKLSHDEAKIMRTSTESEDAKIMHLTWEDGSFII